MTKCYCDRCGARIALNLMLIVTITNQQTLFETTLDLCPSCGLELKRQFSTAKKLDK